LEKHELGKSGEKIPVVGMGTWEIGDSKEEARAREIQAIRNGVELGMSLIDTAEMYGYGDSERLIGEAIKDIRDDVFVATKASPEHFGYEALLRACEESLRRLDIKHIDLYQLHWPSYHAPIEETMRAMQELVSRGKIRYIGVSNFSVAQTKKARDSLPRSEIVSNQVRYSLTHRSVEAEVLPFCEKEKLTIIAYKPLDSGRLPLSRIPKAVLDKYGMTPAQLMLNWVTYNDAVLAIPKASNLKHVQENAEAVRSKISADDYNKLSKMFSD
jgi:diketogulonate reductase-like aldo/keto reductase